jgi:outer membrane lipoprotein-sorting protein
LEARATEERRQKTAAKRITPCALRHALCAYRFQFTVYCVPVVLLLVAFFASAGRARAASDLVARIQQHYDGIHSLRADFVQQTLSRTASLGTSARGTLSILKPQSMRWDYKKPPQWFLVNGDKTWLYVPEDKTVYEQTLRSPELLRFFSGLDRVAEAFHITPLPADPGPPELYRLELTPRDPEFPVSKVTIWAEPKSYLIVRVQTEDPLGNINRISLSDIRVNVPLAPSLFKLEVPEGARLQRQDLESGKQ